MIVKHGIAAALLAVSFATVSLDISAQESRAPYVLMHDDLSELKADFNEAVDQLRLVFVVGPT
jgi:hypothetical protein